MTLLLHGICLADPARQVEPLVGLHGQPLRALGSDQLTAHFSEVTDSRALGRSDLLEHHGVVATLHDCFDACLPARFPTRFDNEDALRAVLVRRSAEFRQALDRIRGRVELAITVLGGQAEPREEEGEDEALTPGTRYLRQRQRTRRATRTASDQIRDLIAPHAIDVQERVAPRDGVLLSLAVLVKRADAEGLMARLGVSVAERRDVRILINGPWPPYTFAVVQPREA